MVRVADYIANYIYKLGIDTVFIFPGGGSMFLNDGILSSPLKYVSCHHEQAATMAASGYARYNEKLGICYVTTGCGGTNAITGVLGAYQDNIPMLIISGQCKRKETIRFTGEKVRQLGVQEADIISIVKPITKYATPVFRPEDIRYELDKAVYIATHGSPGPVWLDIPLDIQSAEVEESLLRKYDPPIIPKNTFDYKKIFGYLYFSLRPIIIAGHGIQIANATKEFKKFIEKHEIPFVTSHGAIDILPSRHPLYIGRIGTKGDRAGNFAVQNSDLVLSIGCRLSVSTIGQEYELFAREAEKVVVDINPEEHKKNTIKIDYFIKSDAKSFLTKAYYLPIETYWEGVKRDWQMSCQIWKRDWPVYKPEYAESEKVNLYYFIERLSHHLKPDSLVVADAGSTFFVTAQAIKLKEGQRLILSMAQAEMGFTVPACVGASIAKKGEVIGLVGDGSFQLNVQELATIRHHNLPIKLFLWNNSGYLTIKLTQGGFFKRFIGCGTKYGLSFPNYEKIAGAYSIKYFKVPNSKSLDSVIEEVLAYDGPALCDVLCLEHQEIIPRVSSYQKPDGTMASRPMEDMYPFLDRKEFLENMIIKPVEIS